MLRLRRDIFYTQWPAEVQRRITGAISRFHNRPPARLLVKWVCHKLSEDRQEQVNCGFAEDTGASPGRKKKSTPNRGYLGVDSAEF
jgi:hypothetical protein